MRRAARIARRGDAGVRSNRFATPAGRAILGSERLIPLEYPVPIGEPDVVALRAQVVEFIDAAAARGALDAGTAAFVDAWIGAHLAGWLALVEEEDRRRRDIAGFIVGGRRETADAAMGTLDDLRRRIAELEIEQQRRRAILGGHHAPVPDAPDHPVPSLTAIRAVSTADDVAPRAASE